MVKTNIKNDILQVEFWTNAPDPEKDRETIANLYMGLWKDF